MAKPCRPIRQEWQANVTLADLRATAASVHRDTVQVRNLRNAVADPLEPSKRFEESNGYLKFCSGSNFSPEPGAPPLRRLVA